MKKILLLITIAFGILLIPNSEIQANDFSIESSFDIYLENTREDKVQVQEKLHINSNNPNYYIPANSEQMVTIPAISSETTSEAIELKKETLQVQDKAGRNLDYELTQDENILVVRVKTPRDISQNNPFTAEITYESSELVNQNGNISNLYLPGLHQNTQFEEVDPSTGLTTTYKYKMTYHVPLDAPKHSFISPESINTKEGTTYRKYEFPAENRMNNTGWIQLGTKQYYYFEVTQEIPNFNENSSEKLQEVLKIFSENLLELTLPKEFEETKQQVFIKSMEPEPTYIRLDEEENVISVFDINETKKQEVNIQGYIKLSSPEIPDIPNPEMKEYMNVARSLENFEKYTQEDKYWESEHPEIVEIAEQLENDYANKGVSNLIEGVYSYVTEELTYSKEKARGENPRLGAVETLRGAPAVCMEYADLMIAILRAQNIPAKAAMGYGNDPHLVQDSNDLASEMGHQWIQVWLPDYGWLSVDPTWGETNREYIGGDLDHVLWYTEGDAENMISDIMIYSSQNIDKRIFDTYNVTVKPKHEDEIHNLQQLKGLQTIIEDYEKDEDPGEKQNFEEKIQETVSGKTLISILPAIIILVTTLVIVVTISQIIKSKRT